LSNPAIQDVDGGVVISVKVVPHSSKTALAGMLGQVLKVKVSAPAEKQKANQCLIAFLAQKLNVNKSNISIVSGRGNPVKRIMIRGISADSLLDRFGI